MRCFEVDVGVVDESLCDPEIRPEDKHRKCKTMDCPARSLVINVLSVSVTVNYIFLIMRKGNKLFLSLLWYRAIISSRWHPESKSLFVVTLCHVFR